MTRFTPPTIDHTVSQQLADYVVDLEYSDLPPRVVEQTKHLIVYHLGLALRARTAESGVVADRVAQALGVIDELGALDARCSIVGERRKTDVLGAVFANSSLLDSAGIHDFQVPPGIHHGVITQPVAWAVGEAARASGRELLTALVVGYDIAGKLARTVSTWGGEWPRRPCNVFGPLGAAATAARLSGLSRKQTAHALGHAAHAGMGLIEGTGFLWPYHPLLARNGVMAMVLAKAGLDMTSSSIEGRHGLFRTFFDGVPDTLNEVLRELGDRFEITDVQTKRYQASANNILPIQLMMELINAHDLTADRLSVINVVLPIERQKREEMNEDDLAKDPLRGGAGPGSLRFLLAVVAADGRLSPGRFHEPLDATMRSLHEKIRLTFEAERPSRYARLEVTTTDGMQWVVEGDSYDFPPIDWHEWLTDGGGAILSRRQLSRALDLVDDLENVADITDLMSSLRPDDGGGRVD